VAEKYGELVPFAAVLPTLEQEENRIGDNPRQIRRNSAVLFIAMATIHLPPHLSFLIRFQIH
jgi:hypothetical protein